jgi:hypothetical protein
MPASFGEPMPDHVLERIALRWAARRDIAPAKVILREEDLGWTVWAPGHPAAYSTFVDKVTGREVGFANPNDPDRRYAQQLAHEDGRVPRPGFGGPGADPPALTAEVSLAHDRRYYPPGRAVSVKTGGPPTLHPVVAARLAAVPARARVRGAERHAELVALGTAVEAADAVRAQDGLPPITAADLDGPELRTFAVLHRLRDPGDPRAGGSGANPCATCAQVLGLRRPADRTPVGGRLAAYARLHVRSTQPAAGVIAHVAATAGVHARHEVSAAATRAIGHYLGARWDVEAPGLAVRTARFAIDPLAVAESADSLARVAARVGAPLFPFGRVGAEGILAVAADGRVLLVDESGEWLLGRGPRRALDTLALGRSARRLV